MSLEGLHHVTAITGDAQANVDFYAGVLGLRLVKQTVNFDAPDVYHLYYGDEQGSPGSLLTFFELPGAAPGRAGDGMIHRVEWRVAERAALSFWEDRLGTAGIDAAVLGERLRFADPEGLEHELRAGAGPDAPLTAAAPGIPVEHAILGLHGVRAFAAKPSASSELLAGALGFEPGENDGAWVIRGERQAELHYDSTAAGPAALSGAGTVHHVAWAVRDDDALLAARDAAQAAGAQTTPVIDRRYFHSVYFREPSGVLFELATHPPGFTVDEPAATLGEALSLPPQYEQMREQLERTLTPLRNPRRAPAR